MADASASRAFDAAALVLSSLCLVHCLALPLAAALLPVLGMWAHAEWVHWLFAGLSVPASLGALLLRPLDRWALPPLALALLGCLGLFVGAALGERLETWITVGASLVLATAHVLNWRRPHRHG